MSRSQFDWRAALKLYREGWTYSAIAREYGCNYHTVSRHLRALGAKTYPSPAWGTDKGLRLYGVWSRIRARRGPDWDRFRPFYGWAIRTGYRPGLRLVLIADDADFAPGNCRWSARRPERRPTSAGVRIRAFGETKTATEWARDPRCSVSRPTLRERLLEGVAPETAMRTPPRSKWDPHLPKGKNPVLANRTRAVIDWERVLRLRVKQGMSMMDIAARIGVPYPTIQVGLLQRLGSAVHKDAPRRGSTRRCAR